MTAKHYTLRSLVAKVTEVEYQQVPEPTVCVHVDDHCFPVMEVEWFDDAIVHASGAIIAADTRQDAETWLRQRQLEAQMYSGPQGSLGGGGPSSSWCKAHPRACASYRAGAVIAIGSMIFGSFHGRNPEDPVVSESPK